VINELQEERVDDETGIGGSPGVAAGGGEERGPGSGVPVTNQPTSASGVGVGGDTNTTTGKPNESSPLRETKPTYN